MAGTRSARPLRVLALAGLALPLVLPLAIAMPAGIAGGQDPGCAQPYSPVASTTTEPDTGPLPTVAASPVSRGVPARPVRFDSDGDGVDDTVTGGPGQVTISRGDGDVVLTAPGTPAADAYGVGDLDGDGRDELVVYGSEAAAPNDHSFLVPGTVSAGTATFAEVGIDVAETNDDVVPVGDEAGQVLIVSAFEDGTSSTEFWDGETLLVPGPGGSTATLRPSFASGGTPVAFAGQEGPRDLIVLVNDLGDHTEVNHVADQGDFTHLTSAPEPYQQGYPGPGDAAVLVGPDGTFVRLTLTDRGTSTSYLWSLEDPCTPLGIDEPTPPTAAPPGGSSPSAPAAQPITTAATFTG